MRTRKRKPHIAFILAISLVGIPFSVSAQAAPPTNYEGFGAVTRGALDSPGGYETYHVTSLADDGSFGTLRDAVSQGSRYIVFDIGGTITLTTDLWVRDGYITIDGSTSPDPGITVALDPNVDFAWMPNANDINNIIVKYIRVDGGAEGHPDSGGGDILGLDAMSYRIDGVIFDHVTATAASDGIFDMVDDVNNVTISNCFIFNTELCTIVNGGQTPGQNANRISMHHNVYARCDGRQPLLKREVTNFDFVNNVIYGWGYFEAGDHGAYFEYTGGEINPDGEFTKNVYHFVVTDWGDPEDALLFQDYEGVDRGNITFTENLFPPEETEDVSYGTPTVIPAEYKPTEYDPNTLGDTVVPYVGTHYPTQEEQDLLSEISIAIGGQGHVLSLSSTSTSGGSVTNPGEGSFPYDDGTIVSIEATADGNYYFVNWTGTAVDAGKVANASATSTTVTIDAYYTIQANFATDLFISSTSGGSVTNPGEGPFLYDDGTVVSIQATADDNYHFVNWTGTAVDAGQLADPGSASTTVTMDADYTLRANFSIDQHNLTIPSTSGGTVTTPGEGTYPYDHGTAASVIAAPTANYHFVNWTGTAVDAGKVGNPSAASTTVTADADYTIQANFVIDQHTLTIPSTSGGTVTTPGEGTYPYDHGTAASLIATPTANYHFVDWTGTAVDAGKVANPNAASTTVTVDADYTIRANFGESDGIAPTVTNRSPDANDIQVPLNSLISLHVTDAGIGVDANSVTINVNNDIVYSGNTDKFSSAQGECYKWGTKADYTFIYQSNKRFYFDQAITVIVNATDLAGNSMDEYSYSFQTKMRSFGKNKKVNKKKQVNVESVEFGSASINNDRPATCSDSEGNVWVTWHAGATSNKDIYVNKLTAGSEAFGNSIKLTDSTADQRNPTIAVGNDDKLYVAWQDSRRGNWDIYVSTSTDGVNWSAETRVTDSNDNQYYPAIVVDSSNKVYIVWEDSRNGNQDIYIGASNNGFVSTTVSQITSDLAYQGEPAIAVDSDNTVYVVWTDKRISGENDIYGAASNNPWTNIPVVTEENNSQSSPAIATETTGSILHLVWVDDRLGDNDIFYDKTTSGLGPLTGNSIIDDTTGADQLWPVIAVTGSTANGLRVFACWSDERWLSSSGDTDIFFDEITSNSREDVFVGDDGTNTGQTEPAINIDVDGYPYLVWTDNRNMNTDIYYAGSTFIESTALASGNISTSSTVTVGTPPNAIDNVDDVSVVVPAEAYPCDIEITISKITNPLAFSMPCLGGYDFGPSNLEFSQPVTVTIPYNATESATVAYWYNSLTDSLSQQGITDFETIVVSSNLHALRFKTTHFTPFYVFLVSAGGAAASGGGGGGGGCSMSANSQASALELLLPYIGLTVTMVVLKLKDKRKKKARNIT